MLAEGRALAPQEPRLLLMEARVARAAGDNRRAARALEAAAEQRRAQIGSQVPGPVQVGAFSVSSVDNPFLRPYARVEAGPSGDALSAEIARELEALHAETAPRIVAAPGIRSRSGTGGIDRLDELSTTIEASGVPGAVGARLALRATAVAASSGDMADDPAARRRFGSNARAGPLAGRASSDTSATGLGLGLAWQRGSVAVDAGTTPLGIPRRMSWAGQRWRRS